MSHKKFKPLGSRILVKRSEAALSKGGILLPDSAQEKPKQGRGYFQGAVGFSYRIQSSDLYLTNDRGAVKIISTDHKRAIKIAEILKDQLKLDYSIKRIKTAKD